MALGAVALAQACAPVYSETAPPTPRVSAGMGGPPPVVAAEVRGNEGAPSPALVRALASLVWPLAADGTSILSSDYGDRVHPRGGDERFHGGLDLRAGEGTPVYASADGVVIASEASGAYGNLVVLDHGGGLGTLYAHQRENLVRVGEVVRRGQPIGLVGHTGNATGDHLHFEVHWKDGTVDPRTVLPLLSMTTGR